MSNDDPRATYLQRAAEAQSMAASASNFMLMDAYMDIAAAWRAIAAEAAQLAARRKALEAPVSILTWPAGGARTLTHSGARPRPSTYGAQQSAVVLLHPAVLQKAEQG